MKTNDSNGDRTGDNLNRTFHKAMRFAKLNKFKNGNCGDQKKGVQLQFSQPIEF
jgi:hypothetical protein